MQSICFTSRRRTSPIVIRCNERVRPAKSCFYDENRYDSMQDISDNLKSEPDIKGDNKENK